MIHLKRRIGYVAQMPILFMHELCHYVPALLFGFRPKLDLKHGQIIYYPERVDWRVQVVTAAPILAGFVYLVALGAYVLGHGDWFMLFPIVGSTLLWWGHSWRDFYCLWFVARYKRWPTDEDGPQHIPFIGGEFELES